MIARTLNEAWRVLTRNPLRSTLMMLGVIVGVGLLTSLSSVGEATRQETLRQFKRMVGTFDTLTVRPGAASTRGMPSLTSVEPTLRFEDAPAIAADVDGVLRVAQVQQAFDIDASYLEKSATPGVFGVSADWTTIRGDEIIEGSDLSLDDQTQYARVAVIGEETRRQLFGDEAPLGKIIRIANVPFEVKGVFASRGAGPGGSSLDNIVVIPVTTASRRLFNRDYLTNIIVQLEDPTEGPNVAEEIRSLMRQRHAIAAGAPDDFTVTSPRATVEKIAAVDSVLSRILQGLAAVASLIGGVVIMNLMLAGVTARRREIGMRRALGATAQDIRRQFLIESVLVSVAGGVLGIVLGLVGALGTLLLQGLPWAWNLPTLAVAAALSVALGIVFGLYPAARAARIDPIDALRSG